MRRLTILVAAMMVSLLLSVVPVLSAERTLREEIMTPKKDMCLLFARNCQDNSYVLQQRIERLQGEINKGTAVYNDDELNILRKRLDDANKAIEFVFIEGA